MGRRVYKAMSELPPGTPAGPVPPDLGRGDAAAPDVAAPDAAALDALPSDAVLGAGAPDWAALARTWIDERAADAQASERETPTSDSSGVADARRWLAAHPDEAARMTALGQLLDAAFDVGPAAAAPVDVEAALARVTHRRLAGETPAEAAPQDATRVDVAPRTPAPARRTPAPAWSARPPAPRWSRRRLAGVGIAVVALLAAGVGLARRWTPVGPPAVAVAAAQHHRTEVGQRDSIRLADGTRVILGPSTSLDVLPGYGGSARTVALDGEAYFEVVHDGARPFSVVAGPAIVRDLGTAFTVRHDDADHIAVAVTQGAVRLTTAEPPADPAASAAQPTRPVPHPAAGDSGLVLRAGERGMVAPGGRRGSTATRLPGRADDDTAWTSGRLVFRDAPLPEVAAALRRWYGVEFRVTDPALAGRHLTATFRGEPLPDVLRVVGLALGARLDRHGDTVLVRPPR